MVAGVCVFLLVCGMALARKPQRLVAPPNSLPASRIVGTGLNCHGERLPISDLKAIGITWVRLDLPGSEYTSAKLKGLVAYYHDFGQLWILPKSVADTRRTAKLMVQAGITEIEVFNEPELDRIPASSYVDSFRAVRDEVGASARLYGPCICTWLQRSYLEDCVQHGLVPDAITFHGYHQQTPERLASWVGEAKSYGLPVVVSELGFPNYLGSMAYRVRMRDSIGALFVKTRDAMKDTPWCWYDGPNPVGDYDCGLFDGGSDTGYHPNKNYRDVRSAISRSRS